MKKSRLLVAITLLLFACFQELMIGQDLSIITEIDFGNKSDIIKKNVKKDKNITALEALQLTAKIETKVLGEYVIVTSVNDVKSEPGKTAWYYKVNGEPAKVLAINNELNDGDIVRWIFQEDVCTKTVTK